MSIRRIFPHWLSAGLVLAFMSQPSSDVCAQQHTDTLTVALTGDVLLGTTYPTLRLPANGGEDLFRESSVWLKRADLALGNLEGPICDTSLNNTTKNRPNRYAFRCPKNIAHVLADAGYGFLSLANNHIHDFGKEGVKSTAAVLDSLGIAHAGDIWHRRFVVVKRKGIRIAICAFGHNVYTYRHRDSAFVAKTLKAASAVSDVVIVSFHGGAEGVEAKHLPYGEEKFIGEPRGSLRKFAHFCVRHGADIIYGHGPHVVRCVELCDNRFIAYSLGNFCTPFGISVAAEMGYAPMILVKVLSDGTFVSGQIYSYLQKPGTGPRYDYEHKATLEIKSLTETDQTYSPVVVSKYGEIISRHKTDK